MRAKCLRDGGRLQEKRNRTTILMHELFSSATGETGTERWAASLTYERAGGKHVPLWLEAWSRETPDSRHG